MVLDVGLDAAKASVAKLARSGLLVSASEAAYDEGITGLVRVGPLGSAPGLSRLVEVRFLDLVSREDSALLVLRWEATGPSGGLFPALDADITLTPAGEHATLLTGGRSVPAAARDPRRRAGPGDLAPGCRRNDPGVHEPGRGCHRPSR